MVRGRRFTPLAVSMVLAAALAVTIPVASAATAAAATVAPGAPGAPSYFDLARKDCLGTAAGRGSKVWYTVAGGVLSDVYEPTIDNTDVSTLQYVVTDGATFTDLQARDMTYTVAADPTGMACTVTSTDAKHGFRLVTTYITDPASDTVLMSTRLQALPRTGANLGRLHLYARLDAHVNGNGGGGSDNAGANSGVVDDPSGVPVVFSTNTVTNAVNRAYAVPTYMALAATSARAASVGYAGTASDGLTQLDSARALTPYNSAPGGHVVATEDVTPGGGHEVTLALGFGRTQAQSVSVTEASLAHPFGLTAASYLRGWVSYDASLRTPPGNLRGSYYLSANVLKASEDKTFPGAIVASLASPWGQSVQAGVNSGGKPSYFGSYREVFARDLYEAFTGLLADGDIGTARAATRFLFDRQQLPDGSMPRNSLLNGKAAPDTGGTQLDEAAYPILMAYLAGLGGDAALWKGHIEPAADFLVANGPSLGVERWEEQSGYSPSTIAAEIAGLTAASAIAASHGDAARAGLYQATADDFQRNIKSWTVTTTGPDAPRYFIRLSKTGDPNAAISYSLGNGGPTLDQRAVIDGGFQELTRLGELPVSDPDVRASLGVLDKQISVSTPSGTGYYRYGNDAAQGSADGYGDCYQPSQTTCAPSGAPWPPTGKGTGHLWPNLSGERAESDLAAGDRSGAQVPAPGDDQLLVRRGARARAGLGKPGPARLAVRQRPGHRLDRVHQGEGGRLGVPADLGAGAGSAAHRLSRRWPQRGHPGRHHRALHHPRGARDAAGDDHRAGRRQHPGRDVHHRDREDRGGGVGDDRVGRHHDRGLGRGDQHDRGVRRVLLGDRAGQLRQQRHHRDRHRERGTQHRLRPGHRHQRGWRQHRARRDRPLRRRQRARHLPVPDRLRLPRRSV